MLVISCNVNREHFQCKDMDGYTRNLELRSTFRKLSYSNIFYRKWKVVCLLHCSLCRMPDFSSRSRDISLTITSMSRLSQSVHNFWTRSLEWTKLLATDDMCDKVVCLHKQRLKRLATARKNIPDQLITDFSRIKIHVEFFKNVTSR